MGYENRLDLSLNRGIEYLTFSRFYFQIKNYNKLLISKVSGLAIEIDVTDQSTPIGSSYGSSAGPVTRTQATPTGVTTQNVTLEFISTYDNNVLYQWYIESHPKPAYGGGRAMLEQRSPCSLYFLNQEGDIALKWDLLDAVPVSYKTMQLQSDNNELFKETVEIAHTQLVRVDM